MAIGVLLRFAAGAPNHAVYVPRTAAYCCEGCRQAEDPSALVAAGMARAQVHENVLHSFTSARTPSSGVTLAGDTLYGTANPIERTGLLYKLDAAGYTELYRFTGGTDGGGPSPPPGLRSECRFPYR